MNWSFGKKMAAIITVALFSFVVVSLISLASSWRTYKTATKLGTAADAFLAASHLIHEAQREHANSILIFWGTTSAEDLTKIRKNADAHLNQLVTLTNELKISAEEQKHLDESRTLLTEIRKSIDDRNEIAVALEKYALVVHNLIMIQVTVSRLAPLDGLDSTLLGLTLLEQAKENASLLRARMATVLSANTPIAPVVISFMENQRSGLTSNVKSPVLVVSPKTRTALDQFIQSDQWNLINLMYEGVISRASSGGFGLNHIGFFNAMTEVIESLGTIVVDETTQVHSLVQKRVSQTLRTFYATAFSLVTVLLVIFLISRTFTIKLSKQIEEIAKRVASGASNVEHGSQDVAQLATQLSQGTHDQSAALHRTASTLDQVSATTQKNAETAHKSRAIIRLKPKKPPNVAVRLCPT